MLFKRHGAWQVSAKEKGCRDLSTVSSILTASMNSVLHGTSTRIQEGRLEANETSYRATRFLVGFDKLLLC